MGSVESQLEDDPKYTGFRIYKIFKDGPISFSEAKVIEDFIIPPREVTNYMSFIEFLKQNENKLTELTLYSIKKRCFHKISITPHSNWGEGRSGFIGASVRLENWSTGHKNLIKVLNVKPDSIAEKAGIKSTEDWIIAVKPIDDDIFSLNVSANDPLTNFTYLMDKFKGKNVELIMYNLYTGVKYVELFLNENERLGCDVGYGKLHEFVKESNDESKRNKEKLEDGAKIKDTVNANANIDHSKNIGENKETKQEEVKVNNEITENRETKENKVSNDPSENSAEPEKHNKAESVTTDKEIIENTENKPQKEDSKEDSLKEATSNEENLVEDQKKLNE